jgi:hypothetical protein
MNCRRHEKPLKQGLKKRFKYNFQSKNKTLLCDSKTKTRNMKDKHDNEFLLC